MSRANSCLIVGDSQMIRDLERDLVGMAGFTDIQVDSDGELALRF